MQVKKLFMLVLFLGLMFGFLQGSTALAQEPDQEPVAEVEVNPTAVKWRPHVQHAALLLTVSGPDGFYFQEGFQSGTAPELRLRGQGGVQLPDGNYTYELVVIPTAPDDTFQKLVAEAASLKAAAEAAGSETEAEEFKAAAKVVQQRIEALASERSSLHANGQERSAQPLVQSGSFSVSGSKFVTQQLVEDSAANDLNQVAAPEDFVIVDDLIVDGSACIGFDCVNGESFGFTTLRLKENNLRIEFLDTSSSASFPTRDWWIEANSSANGGASYLGFRDLDSNRLVFAVEANAPSNALYVDDGGRIGVGTGTPSVEMHIVDGDTPTVRLEQSGTSGWTPQTWDVAGNETNFFIRDVTNGSQLPFKILPGASNNSLVIDSEGEIGIGTRSPEEKLHVMGETNDHGTAVIESQSDSQSARLFFRLPTGIDGLIGAFGISYTTVPEYADKVVVQSIGRDLALAAGDTNDQIHFYTGGRASSNKRVVIDESGNVGIGTASPTQKLHVAGNVTADSYLNNSNVNLKENFASVDNREILASLVEVPITTWSFKDDAEKTAHMGPTAQDFYTAFGLGGDDKYIALGDAVGVTMAAVQGLNEVIAEKDAQLSALEQQNADLESRVSALEGKINGTPAGTFNPTLPLVIGLFLVGFAMGRRRVSS